MIFKNIKYIVIAVLFISCKKNTTSDFDFYKNVYPLSIHYTSENSVLPSNKIKHLNYQNGKLFVSTEGGMCVLDNENWTVYTKENSQLPDNVVNASVLYNDVLWIATNSGLVKLQNNSWQIYTMQNSPLPVNKVRSLAVDNSGVLWIGTFSGGGLCKFDGTTWQVYTPSNSGLPNNSVAAVAVDNNGFIWASTGGGLTKFDGQNTWTVYRTNNSGLPHNQVYCIAFEGNKKWIGTNGGIGVFDDVNWKTYTSSNSPLPLDLVRAIDISIGNDGKKYIATEGKGVAIIDKNEKWEIIDTHSKPLKSGYISSVLKVENKLWIASQDNGLMLTIEK